MSDLIVPAPVYRKRGRPRKVVDQKFADPVMPVATVVESTQSATTREISRHRSVVVTRLAVVGLVEHEACAMLPRTAAAAIAVRNSVEDVGILHPLVVTSDGRLLDGRYRLEAARELGFEQVTAIVYDPESPAEYVFHCKASREHLDDYDRAVLAVQYQRVRTKELSAGRTRKMNAARLGTKSLTVAEDAPRVHAADATSTTDPTPRVKQDSRKEACDRFGPPQRTFRAVKRMADRRPDLFKKVLAGTLGAADAVKRATKNGEIARAVKAAAVFVRPKDVGDGEVENRIHVGDAAEVLARVADGVASLVLFSPPYPGVKNDEYVPPLPVVSYAQYLADLRPVLEQSLRVTRAAGSRSSWTTAVTAARTRAATRTAA